MRERPRCLVGKSLGTRSIIKEWVGVCQADRGEKEKESFRWRELGAKARRWESGWESVSSQEGWLEHRGSAGQQDAAAALNARLVLSPEGAGEPWNGFEERRNVIRTVCPKCISGSSEEVGPEWGDGWEAGRALRMHVREET